MSNKWGTSHTTQAYQERLYAHYQQRRQRNTIQVCTALIRWYFFQSDPQIYANERAALGEDVASSIAEERTPTGAVTEKTISRPLSDPHRAITITMPTERELLPM